MKSYIIRLSDFSNSIEWSNRAYETAKFYNWDVSYFEGINGLVSSLSDYNIVSNKLYKKAQKSFEKPGPCGCFLSHYLLWNKCIELNESICVLEHDTIINNFFPDINFKDILKFVKGPKTKPAYIGEWWASGAGYCVSVTGATKLVNFVKENGAMPADVMLNTGIVDIQFHDDSVVTIANTNFSFTKDL